MMPRRRFSRFPIRVAFLVVCLGALSGWAAAGGSVAQQADGVQAAAGVRGSIAQQLDGGQSQASAGGREREAESEAGIPVDHQATVTYCVRCHAMDDSEQMTRISYMRKTPEGWQMSVRRMVLLNDVDLEPEVARDIVRYLSNRHGLAPEEARPGLFEAERRMIDHDYADDDTEELCIQCHSMGRVITQRRSEAEWELLVATHRGYYPLVDRQGSPGFRRSGPPRPGSGGDRRHPMERAIEHLAEEFPLESAEWADWSANRRPPRLAGRWAVAGYAPGAGPLYGTLEIAAVDGAEGEFTTTATLNHPKTGGATRRSGRAIVYTGFQWRGSSAAEEGGPAGGAGPSSEALREVMFVERDWRRMSGRWFTGAYDELGIDVTLHRADVPQITGVYPVAVRAGTAGAELTVFGANLPAAVAAAQVDFGPDVEVTEVVAAGAESIRVRVDVAAGAAIGKRDLFVGGIARPQALAVFDAIDAVRVTPAAGMARVGGAVAPKQLVQFEAIGVSYGADDEEGTDDDMELGALAVTWSLEEYAATFDDDDIEFVGTLDDSGLFTPAIDGPNPERRGNRNNIGDVWVVATFPEAELARPLRGRAHLVVTVPIYLMEQRWETGR